MRRAHIVLISVVAGVALLWVLLFVACHPASLLAAPGAEDVAGVQMRAFSERAAAAVSCTLSVTTTDSLQGTPHYTYTDAVPLANYTGLALAPGDRYATVSSHDDWFALNNATLYGNYQIDALPDGTVNYNLGMIVYNASLTPIYTDTDSATNNSAGITFMATTYGPYYIQVFQLIPYPGCTGGTYHLNVSVVPPTAIPTLVADPYELNDSFAQAFTLPVATSLELSTYAGVANFYPVGDEDWYAFYCKNDKWYQVTTSELSGVDTRIEIRNRNNSGVTSNDDGGGGYASLVSFKATYNGYYYIRVQNKVSTTGTYNMSAEEVSTPATATPGPGPSSGADACEDNGDFDKACVIAANDPKTFNFVPPYGGVDNDFFKMWIKSGFLYECSTSYLDAGVDPNLIVFTGPSWDNGIGGNDDVEPGDLNSYFSYYSSYTGWLYLLVGYGDRTPSDISNSNYTFECKMTVPGEPTSTPAPTSGAATAAPIPTNPPSTAPPAGLTVRSLTTPTPVPESGGVPESQFMRIKVVVYYDANGDGEPGAGEGIAGISVKAYEAAANQQLAQQFTDEQGYLEFTVSARGPVRVSVPFFGFSQLVSGEEATIRLRVPSQPLPGGEPQ